MDLRKVISGACLVAALMLGAYSLGAKGCDWKWPVVVPTPPVVPVVVAPPFVADKLTVLVIHDAGSVGSLPSWVQGNNADKSLEGWTHFHGGSFRLMDASVASNTSLLEAKWAAAATALIGKGPPPWIVAAGPETGFNQKLPASFGETIKLMEGVK